MNKKTNFDKIWNLLFFFIFYTFGIYVREDWIWGYIGMLMGSIISVLFKIILITKLEEKTNGKR